MMLPTPYNLRGWVRVCENRVMTYAFEKSVALTPAARRAHVTYNISESHRDENPAKSENYVDYGIETEVSMPLNRNFYNFTYNDF